MLYRFLNSGAGLSLIQDLSWEPVEHRIRESVSTAAFDQVMRLSSDFHESKRSGEIQQAMSQARSVDYLVYVGFFNLLPVVIDIVVAVGYLYSLFGVYMSLIAVMMGFTYTWLFSTFDSVQDQKRQRLVDSNRHESSVLYEAISKWNTVFVRILLGGLLVHFWERGAIKSTDLH